MVKDAPHLLQSDTAQMFHHFQLYCHPEYQCLVSSQSLQAETPQSLSE